MRAVGTQFDVYRKKSGTTVTVVEGRVAVTESGRKSGEIPLSSAKERGAATHPPREESSGSATVFVSAGEQVTVTEQQVAKPKRTNIAATTAWTQHRLIFDGTPLGDVVDDFNRYNTRQLVVEDEALDDFHVSGVYSSTDPASLIRFLREQPGVDVIETDERVRITRK